MSASSARSRRRCPSRRPQPCPDTITAWERLFDRLWARCPGKSLDPRTLLITGGAGGVGSILIQLARR